MLKCLWPEAYPQALNSSVYSIESVSSQTRSSFSVAELLLFSRCARFLVERYLRAVEIETTWHTLSRRTIHWSTTLSSGQNGKDVEPSGYGNGRKAIRGYTGNRVSHHFPYYTTFGACLRLPSASGVSIQYTTRRIG